MAQQSEFDRLRSAWRALAGENKKEGWRTIPIEQSGSRRLLAGRHFPGNTEAILIGFHSVHLPAKEQLPQGQGFHVEQVKNEVPGSAHVWIALSRKSVGSLDMFARMAEDVIAMLESYRHVDDQTLFQLFLGRIKAWQKFMHQARTGVLGLEEEIGLAGELHFLKLLLERGLPAASVIEAWQGPLDGLHDFLLGSGAMEVKSTTATHGFPATAGSLEQFDASLVSILFLVGVRFMVEPSGATLPEIVDDIACRLEGEPDTKGIFETLLLRAGFLRAFSDRYKRRLAHSETRILLVDGEFPALTRSNVNPAIRKACYELDLDLVSAPRLDLNKALEKLRVTL